MLLNPRLETALSILLDYSKAGEHGDIPSFSRLFDVGCDHALLCIEAIRRKIAEKAWAMDIREGPLEIARRNIRLAGLQDKITVCLSDGLDEVIVESGDAVSILGMGGLEIGDIASRVNWPSGSTIVVQPMRSLPELRMKLAGLGLEIVREEICLQKAKLYLFFLLKVTNKPKEMAYEDALIGPYWYDNWQKSEHWPQHRENLLRVFSLMKQADTFDEALVRAGNRLAAMI